MGAIFFSGPSSAPWTAAMVRLDGLFEVVLVPHAARKAGSEVKAAPVTAVRLTNSRRLIRCIPFPPMFRQGAAGIPRVSIVLRLGCHDYWFLRSRPQVVRGMGARRGPTDTVLDRASPVPLYYQLAQNMETDIRSGRLSSGSHLDNEIELARQLGVSRPTVRRAIGLLANKGLVIRRHGIGTLVVPVRVRRPVRLSSLYDDLKESGEGQTTRLLAFEHVPAPARVANALKLPRGPRVLHFERLRLATDQPISLMVNFLPVALEELVTE